MTFEITVTFSTNLDVYKGMRDSKQKCCLPKHNFISIFTTTVPEYLCVSLVDEINLVYLFLNMK